MRSGSQGILPTTELESKRSYAIIKQLPSEGFLQFVEQLRDQVERQIEYPVAQVEVLKEMAQNNANEACRRGDPGPTSTPSTYSHTNHRCMYKESRTPQRARKEANAD
ncbi:hypothetical protein DUI87_04017 [Hirundo rustica rustica]|uniref:Retroviral nucleocapsid Gag protein p24 C-terminal domain-containing protein n=1 Tax=Hirundo rustica rustica TaxID=333673 RepID=A0A3M0LJW5_HIRRU|nr:hypothetical protein DUI87_04017 [Hirundo rustica rustica]